MLGSFIDRAMGVVEHSIAAGGAASLGRILERVVPTVTARAGYGTCCQAYGLSCGSACVLISGSTCANNGKRTLKNYYSTVANGCGTNQCGCQVGCCAS